MDSGDFRPCFSLRHPLPASITVLEARDAYLAENGFTLAGYDAPWTKAAIFGVSFAVPNTAAHRWAIMLHDLHHVATGYGTDLAGETEISGWEARRGLAGLNLYVKSIVMAAVALGIVAAPRRLATALSRAGRGATLFDRAVDYESLLRIKLGDLRMRLGVPSEGLAGPRALHAHAPRARDLTQCSCGRG